MASIKDLLNLIAGPNSALATYAQNQQGNCIIASDLQHAWGYCQNNEIFLKLIALYTGEDIRGDFPVAAINHRVDMQFSVVVSRNRGLDANRGQSLVQDTGNARPLFDLVDEVRNLLRGLDSQLMVEWPIDYKGISQWDTGPFITDAYVIKFSLPADLPDFSPVPSDGPDPTVTVQP